MKKYIIVTAMVLAAVATYAQNEATPKVKWFFTPEFSTIFHENHIGRATGVQVGISVLNDHLRVGLFYFGRSGPINNHYTETLVLEDGVTYKGQSSIELGVDNGIFGLVVIPQFQLTEKLTLDIPLSFGQIGAGFYLKDDLRNTPDGRRVSDWENELMGGSDAGFGWSLDGGVRLKFPLNKSQTVMGGIGVHYTHTIGWSSFVGGTDYYKNPRLSFVLDFGN